MNTTTFHRITSTLLYMSILAGLIMAFISPHGTAANPAAAFTHLPSR